MHARAKGTMGRGDLDASHCPTPLQRLGPEDWDAEDKIQRVLVHFCPQPNEDVIRS